MTSLKEVTVPDAARRIAWDAVWDRLLAPPRQEPAKPEHIPTPEELSDSSPRSRGERQS